MSQFKEFEQDTDRGIIMARLARRIGRGHDAIYHGTRHLPTVLRSGKLVPAVLEETAVFFTRSPEIASYWANRMGGEIDQYSGGVLVLNRASLVQCYRLEPSRYTEDWDDEREESVWGRNINFRRHLLGVVRETDVDAIVGQRKHRFYPKAFYSWSQRKKQAFFKEAGGNGAVLAVVCAGRAKVRDLIVRERERSCASNHKVTAGRGRRCDPVRTGAGGRGHIVTIGNEIAVQPAKPPPARRPALKVKRYKSA